MTTFIHCTVLLQETVDLATKGLKSHTENQPLLFADCTLGGAGHTLLLLETLSRFFNHHISLSEQAEVICCDQDPQAIRVAQERIDNWQLQTADAGKKIKVTFLPMNFRQLPSWIKAERPNTPLAGVIADLGVSSPQLDEAERGFSFLREGPLDMRMNTSKSYTAKDLLLNSNEKDLEKIFFEFGEEPKARMLAKAIVKDRQNGLLPLSNTITFAQYVERVLSYHQSRTHPATRVFQALRIAVNEELSAIEDILRELPHLMAPNGTVAIISFHSLEDRLVKHFFKAWEAGKKTPQEKRENEKQDLLERQMGLVLADRGTTRGFGQESPRGGIVASQSEVSNNPRSRSARLRGFQFHSTFQASKT